MKERLLKLTESPLGKLWLLVVFVMTCISASADVEWNDFQTETNYKYSTKAKTYYKYTPTEDGVFYLYYTSTQPSITDKADENGPVTGYYDTDNSWISYDLAKFSWYRNTYNGVFFTSQVEASVKKGNTYYITIPDSWSGGTYCGHLEGSITELKLMEQNFESGKIFDVTDTRYGQLELKFNLGATADQWAYLKIGNYPLDANKEDGKIETRSGANTGSLVFNLKDSVNSWMDKGYFKEGDEMTLTVTGICAKTDENIKYGEDGTLVLKFLAPGKAHNLISSKMPSPFYSYWEKGDTTGIARLVFDSEVMKGDEQTAQVSIVMGYADGAGGAYQEYLDASKIYANGDTLFLDFTDKLRTYETMGLTQQYGSLNINVYNVKMADGTCPYSPGNGHAGSYAFSYVSYKEKNNANTKPEFTPESGETLTDNLKIYFAKKDAYTFSGVKFTYQDMDDRKYQEIVTEGITSEEVGKNGIEYTIPVSDAVKAGKNIRLSFEGLVSSDGLEHSDLCDGIKFNPGDELLSDLAPVETSVATGSVLKSFDKLVLTFGEEVAINKVEGRDQVVFTDKSTGKYVASTIAVDEEDAKKVVITPAAELKNTHKYEITVNEATVVNKQYVETSGKYGNFMTEQTYTFSLNANNGNLDFVADPVEGSILNEISTITCKTDPSRPSSTYFLTASHSKEPWVYVKLVNEQGDSIARATINDCADGDGFTLTFSPAITEPGKYTVVMTDSVYFIGEGYEAGPNEYQVKFDYTVIAAPKAEIEFTATPASEATVSEISEITLTTEEPVYCDDSHVTVFSRALRKSYSATLMRSLANTKELIVYTDEPVTEEGDWEIEIPAGSFGDQTWYDNDCQTGRTNVATTLYYTIGSADPSALYTATPANNSTVEALDEITIKIGEDGDDCSVGNGVITITNQDGEQVFRGDAQGVYDDPDDWFAVTNTFTVTLDEKITTPGTYTMTIPDGYFYRNGDEVDGTTLTWTIAEGGSEESSLYTTIPANNSTVESLSEITIKVGEDGSDCAVGNGVITITNENGEQVFRGDAVAYYEDPDDWSAVTNTFTLSLSEVLSTPGVYTMTIPDGYFVCDGDDVAGATLTYIVSNATGINGISTDNAASKVYSLDGKKMKSANGLKGIYIVNGKKVVLK